MNTKPPNGAATLLVRACEARFPTRLQAVIGSGSAAGGHQEVPETANPVTDCGLMHDYGRSRAAVRSASLRLPGRRPCRAELGDLYAICPPTWLPARSHADVSELRSGMLMREPA